MPDPATTEDLAAYLASGFWADQGSSPIAWDVSAGNVLTVNLTRLSAEGQALARAALDAWATVADLEFQEVAGRADIAFTDSAAGAYTTHQTSGGEITAARVNVSTDWIADYGAEVGGYAFQTFVHEIGHALGLGHAGDYNGSATFSADALFLNDSWQQSVMSYFSQDDNTAVDASEAFVVTPMMADILAIQSIYGAPSGGPTAGDTIWGVGSDLGTYLDDVFGPGAGSLGANALTIYDEGGIDLIDLSDDGSGFYLNLAGGTFSDVRGLEGNLAIAQGTTIENAVAGSGADHVSGNPAGNRMILGGGNDKGYGGAGSDLLDGGAGGDSLYGGGERDSLHGGDGNDRLEAADGDDVLEGQAGTDLMYGGAGADTLRGLSGNDRIEGGDGDDGTSGGSGANDVYGGKGDDRVSGDAGDDRLSSGSGMDSFVYSSGKDVITDFADDADTLLLDDYLWGGAARTPAQVLDAYAEDAGDAVLLDFGSGRTLLVKGVGDVDDLLNDLAFV